MKAAALQMLLDFCSHNTHSSLEMVKEEHKSAVNSFSLWDAFTSAPLRPAASWEVGACAWREKSPDHLPGGGRQRWACCYCPLD